jgi:hypothetical protein
MVIPEQVAAWIDRCQQNIERMQRDGIDPAEFRQQYMILSTIVKVAERDAYFAGTQYRFPPTS